MEISETYKFLTRVREIDSQIMREELTLAEIKSSLLPGAITYDKDRVMTSPEDRLPEVFARIDERERVIKELRSRKVEVIEEIDGALRKMAGDTEDDRARMQVDILYQFYIGRRSVYDIAQSVGVSTRHCFRLKKQAVKNFSLVL